MSQQSIPAWRFAIALLFQSLLILVIPAQAIYTHLSGKTAILQTIPVDPYDFLRGYYQTLRYTISRVEKLQALPGWETVLTRQSTGEETLLEGTRFYVILQAPVTPQSNARPPQPWIPIGVSRDRPTDLSSDRVALEGIYDGGWVKYDLERYYLPEDQRFEINDRIREIQEQPGQERSFVVEVKINREGDAVPVSLWIGDRNYRF
jgi:uncharacterized membrane-anchored protein